MYRITLIVVVTIRAICVVQYLLLFYLHTGALTIYSNWVG